MWTSESDNIKEIIDEVSEALANTLNDQREKLDTVDAKLPGADRYELARQAGCFCAICKGAKYRTLKPEQIYVPRTEFKTVNGKLRITALKAMMPAPEGMVVKAITFRRDNTGTWNSVLECVPKAA